MRIRRGEIWWARLPEPKGSEPAKRRPVLVIQADAFNRSRIGTVIAVAITSNLRLAEAPGNLLVPAGTGELPRDSVVNVSQVATLGKERLVSRLGRLPARELRAVEDGLRMTLGLRGE